jgi:hypothetical protein
VQIAMQIVFSLFFATLCILYGVQAFGGSLPVCEFPKRPDILPTPLDNYNLQRRYEIIFLSGFLIYFIAAASHSLIVAGLIMRKFWLQLVGVSIAVLNATMGQTALIMMIPVFRWNSAGIHCAETTLKPQGIWIANMFAVTIIAWVFSCCAVWGINQSDAQKQFGAEKDHPDSTVDDETLYDPYKHSMYESNRVP